MITYFSVSNFKCFKDKIEINFVANKKRSPNSSGKIKVNNDEVLNAIALFGKNGSGKSTFAESMSFVNSFSGGGHFKSARSFLERKKSKTSKHVNKKFNEESTDEYVIVNDEEVNKIIVERFFFDDKKPIEVMYHFADKKLNIHQNVKIYPNGKIHEVIKDEVGNLLHDTETTFENFNSKINQTGLKLVEAQLWTDFEERYSQFNYQIFDKSIWGSKTIKESIDFLKELYLLWMKIADNKILSIEFDEEDNSPESFELQFNKTTKKVSYSKLSSGTLKYSSLFSSVCYSLLIKQTICIFDEVDRSLHASMVDLIIQLYQNSETNKKSSQLLFTSHNPTVIRDTFRKDAINYIEDFSIVNLGHNLNIREDISFTKNYLAEKFGSHPDAEDKLQFFDKVVGYGKK